MRQTVFRNGQLPAIAETSSDAGCLDVHLAKVDLIKDDLVGMADAVEAGAEGQNGNDGQSDLVVPL